MKKEKGNKKTSISLDDLFASFNFYGSPKFPKDPIIKHRGKSDLLSVENKICLNDVNLKITASPESWENLQDFLVRKKGYHPLDLGKAGLIIASYKSQVTSLKSQVTS